MKKGVSVFCCASQGESPEPSMPALEMNLGLALFKAGDLEEAVQIFSRMLKTHRAGELLATLGN